MPSPPPPQNSQRSFFQRSPHFFNLSLSPPVPVQASVLALAAGLPSTAALLPHLVPLAARSALTPTSAYPVGAAALGVSGAVYLGANLELPGAPLAASVHAEQFVVASAAAAGEAGLLRIAVSAPPCGHCRQFCYELDGADALEFVFFEEGDGGTGGSGGGGDTFDATPPISTLGELLPRAFGPADLARGPSSDGSMAVAPPVGGRPPTPPPGGVGRRGPAFLLAPGPQGARLEWDEAAAATLAASAAEGTPAARSLVAAAEAAFKAASACHAPHTHCPAGVGLVWEGRAGGGGVEGAAAVSAGGVIESAAYNPTLPPLQAALVGAVVGGMAGGYGGVKAAVLVERGEGGRVSHAAGTAAGLACLGGGRGGGAGGPSLTVLRVRWARGGM